MTSPLEQRLVREIEQGLDETSRACSRADLGTYYARVGRFEEAESIRSNLRLVFGDGRSIRVSIRIMILEGALLYYKDLDPKARDRLARANILSVGSGDPTLISISASWLAHLDFNTYKTQSMAKQIASCLSNLQGDDGSAECRVSLVLGDAFLSCGQTVESRDWYERARLAAGRTGDHASFAAITYNRAALSVSLARLRSTRGLATSNEIASASAEVRTAVNYQTIAGIVSLDHLLGAARVGSLILESRESEALVLINELLARSEVPPDSGELALLIADQARCSATLGELEDASRKVSSVRDVVLSHLPPDDRSILYDSLSIAATKLGDFDLGIHFRELSKGAFEEHSVAVEDLRRILADFRR